jgi:hypothetical protein
MPCFHPPCVSKLNPPSQLPHYHIGAVGNSLNVVLFLGLPLFLAFFATRYEWYLPLSPSVFGLRTFQGVMVVFLSLSAFGVILLPYLERVLASRTQGRVRSALFCLAVEPVRYGIVLVSLWLVSSALSQIGWMDTLITNGFYYLLAAVVFVVGMWAAVRWIKHIQNIKGSAVVYALIGFGLAILYYMALTTYEFGVYKLIPCNRGGRLPLTVAYLEVKDHAGLFSEEKTIAGVKVRGPAYIIEENSDYLFVASERMNDWLGEFVPIHVIRKDGVPYVFLERINDGFPRIRRQ